MTPPESATPAGQGQGDMGSSTTSQTDTPVPLMETGKGHSEGDAAPKERETDATRLVGLAAGLALIHDGQDGYAVIRHPDGGRQVLRLRGDEFADWLGTTFYAKFGRVPSARGLEDASRTLAGKARFSGRREAVHVRVAEYEGQVFIDLGGPDFAVLEVSPEGWRVIQKAPVYFVRPPGLLPLPVPERGASLDVLRRFVNVASDDDFLLIVAWMVAAFFPRGPYLLLLLQGGQGASKSTLSRFFRSLIDPNRAPIRSAPRNELELLIAAKNSRVLCYDNLSGVQSWLSDAMCRLSTGGGWGGRKLYTDGDEILMEVQRPVILNGIDSLATRHDLIDRALRINLAPIPPEKRRTEAELHAQFEAARPRILGALLDALSGVLARLPGIKLERMPRMADFARLGVALEQAVGWPPGSFLAALEGNRNEAVLEELAENPVAEAIRQILEAGEWAGTASELLPVLRDASARFDSTLPRNPRDLSNELRRLVPALLVAGIQVAFSRTADARTIRIFRA